MTTIRRFCCEDLLKFANVNIDHLTETVRALSVSRFQLTWAGFLAKQSKVCRLSTIVVLLLWRAVDTTNPISHVALRGRWFPG
jgi:hypothetical protein